MKTRHRNTSSKANKMRWNCEKDGCFNVKHRLKLEIFAECFGGNIMMSDVDGEVERNGQWLRIEWKNPGVGLPVGQRINYERLSRDTPTAIFIVNGDAETMKVDSFGIYRKGKYHPDEGHSLDELKARFVRWYDWVDKARR